MALSEEKEVYLGPRDGTFTAVIAAVFKLAGIKEKYTKILLTEEAIEKFKSAFTSSDVDPENNYEMYELMGDVSAGHFIKWYTLRRFPFLRVAKGVKVVARLLINYGSKQTFCVIAEKLGFWPFISATQDERDREKKSLLEDVLEAFLGVVEDVLDSSYVTRDGEPMVGVGYNVVYKIMKTLFDEIPISLRYEDLYDAKTRLKELFDKFGLVGPDGKAGLGTLLYEEDERGENDKLTTSRVYRVVGAEKKGKHTYGGQRQLLGTGQAALKGSAQQRAAEVAIKFLQDRGYVKPAPPEYQFFAKEAAAAEKK